MYVLFSPGTNNKQRGATRAAALPNNVRDLYKYVAVIIGGPRLGFPIPHSAEEILFRVAHSNNIGGMADYRVFICASMALIPAFGVRGVHFVPEHAFR